MDDVIRARQKFIEGYQELIKRFEGMPFRPDTMARLRASLLTYIRSFVHLGWIRLGQVKGNIQLDERIPPLVIPFLPLVLEGVDQHGTYNLYVGQIFVGIVTYDGENFNYKPDAVFIGCNYQLVQMIPYREEGMI